MRRRSIPWFVQWRRMIDIPVEAVENPGDGVQHGVEHPDAGIEEGLDGQAVLRGISVQHVIIVIHDDDEVCIQVQASVGTIPGARIPGAGAR